MTRKIHIIGAGLSGLSAALQLSLMGEKVTIYETAPYAGGRCRSYYDREMGCRIDNGNHLVLSGNAAVQDYLLLTQAAESMTKAPEAVFPFMDLKTGVRWAVRMNSSRMPWWIFDHNRRVSDTKVLDYLQVLNLLRAGANDTVTSLFDTTTTLYSRFLEPLTLATLNTEPENASAQLLTKLFAQSFGAGGKACQPLIPKIGLSESFVMPCLNTLRQHDAEVKFGHRLRGLAIESNAVRWLDFGGEVLELTPSDWVVLAVPPWVAQDLIHGLSAPEEFRTITNVHFRLEAPHNPSGFTGIIGGLAEWVFVKPGVVSVTISASDRYDEQAQEAIPVRVWQDVAKLFDLDPIKLPAWRVVREKRATFAATPQQNIRRPRAYIGWDNFALAGDWTDTGLPSCIEGAIRSGVKAAQVVMRWS
jgi:squalene-associated FAD-dependent desaturase